MIWYRYKYKFSGLILHFKTINRTDFNFKLAGKVYFIE